MITGVSPLPGIAGVATERLAHGIIILGVSLLYFLTRTVISSLKPNRLIINVHIYNLGRTSVFILVESQLSLDTFVIPMALKYLPNDSPSNKSASCKVASRPLLTP